MANTAHTLPFLIRDAGDMALARACLQSLAGSCPGALLVLYNQGNLSNEEVEAFLCGFNLQVRVLGSGKNDGIARGRMACFDYIWTRHPEVQYISEIHVDMLFPPGWLDGLIAFLEAHPEEPMICPGILTATGELHPEFKGKRVIDPVPAGDQEEMQRLLGALTREVMREGFVHPVLHRAGVLRAVGGYDLRFLTGQQGYEDDSLLLGYRYYMGLKNDWKPKCYLKVRVYHATLAQRASLPGREAAFAANLRGLIYQYGVKGLLELSAIYSDNLHFKRVAEEVLTGLNGQV